MNVLVSACLMGVACRYDGSGILLEQMNMLKDKFNLIPICPEIYGGLKTPREAAEIKNGRVVTTSGEDVTYEYEKGAQEIKRLAQFYNCSYAILKERSPSCGYGKIYDGTFTGQLIEGNGILAELLAKEGIQIFGESSLDELLDKPEK